MCWASMSSMSDFIPWIMESISVCRASPCLSRAVVSSRERFFFYIFSLNWDVYCSLLIFSCKSFCISSLLVSNNLRMSSSWCLCSLEATYSGHTGMLHVVQISLHTSVECFVHFKWHYIVISGFITEMFPRTVFT
mgnify:CR=1 FL=1